MVPRRLAAISLISLGLSGCVSNAEQVMATDRTMQDVVAEVYGDQAQAFDARSEVSREIGEGISDLSGYTRDALNETRILFPKLPNPELAMYVYPHMTEDGTPIPGYTVPLQMYDRTPYAMPGETGGWDQ